MTREEILKEALKCVNGEREQQYGHPIDNFMAIARLWTVYLEHKCVEDNGVVLLHPEDVAAMMALLKIARICTGKYKGDNWVDLAGYAACGGACQSGSRPKEWETEDDEKRRRKAKLETVDTYCNLANECRVCPVKKDEELYEKCRRSSFVTMSELDLDRFLAFFREIAREGRPNCYSCKHRACANDEWPCCECKTLEKYEEDTDEQS